MKESPRSKLLRYLNSSNKNQEGYNVLSNMYKVGLWETYFYYIPTAYTMTKKAVEISGSNPEAIKCWGLYFGVK